MGAWIEILIGDIVRDLLGVAPLVGAWIEIFLLVIYVSTWTVAPLVGAWIEISDLSTAVVGIKSLLSWERGLKYGAYEDGRIFSKSRSSRGSVD